MTSAIVYARFSPRPNAAECESIETQLERCKALCTAKGWENISEHQDRELSGGRADNRPGLQAALDVACKYKGVLVVYSLSRLARNTRDAIAISERLDKCGANLFSLSETIDTLSPTGRFTFTLFAALATLEREQIAQRTSDAMQRHQQNGRRMSERTPYGWARDPHNPALMVENPVEQAVIREILQLSREHGQREICRKLEQAGTQCRGGKWHHATVGKILARGVK